MARPDEGRFQLNEEGICDPLWKIGMLKWSDVKEVFAKSDRRRDFVCIVVRDRIALGSRLGFLRRIFNAATRATGYGDLTIDATRAGIRAEDVVEFASVRITASR